MQEVVRSYQPHRGVIRNVAELRKRGVLTKKDWTKAETEKLIGLKEAGLPDHEIAERLGRSYASTNMKLTRLKADKKIGQSVLPKSSLPLLDSPLKSKGDALILTDVEAPFQHSEFINRCLDLADSWGIQDLHFAGDLLHYDNLSAWGSEWTESAENLTEIVYAIIDEYVADRKREQALERLQTMGVMQSGGLSGELKEARSVFRSFASFKNIYVALGNHDDRYIRALDNAISPNELLHQLDRHNDERWKIAPYYYTLIETTNGTFRATHPRNAGKNAAIDLAVQFHQHVVMGHSHRWSVNRDPSGAYWAIQTGCCVDEKRLAYVQQRDAKRDAHVLGATIIRDGYPFVLSPETPWDLMKRM